MDKSLITGLVLAGGRGSRMGGIDKGLAAYEGSTLVSHALQRLAPQVGILKISANRNFQQYQAMGVPIVADAATDAFEGPLAGMLAGLRACETPWLATVACDTPNFPLDLVQRLADALEAAGAELAMAASTEGESTRLQPVFCLMHRELAASLQSFLASGQRKSERWSASLRRTVVSFDDASAFANANTAVELAQLQKR